MDNIRIGLQVRFRGAEWRVCGITPMGVTPTSVELEQIGTGERSEASPEEITAACSDDVDERLRERGQRQHGEADRDGADAGAGAQD